MMDDDGLDQGIAALSSVVQALANDDQSQGKMVTVSAPVSLKVSSEDQATLTFGPMPIDDLANTLAHLATEEGFEEFMGHLEAGIAAKVAANRAAEEPS